MLRRVEVRLHGDLEKCNTLVSANIFNEEGGQSQMSNFFSEFRSVRGIPSMKRVQTPS